MNVGPGTSDSIPSTESVYGPSQAPGIDVQSNFVVAGATADSDFRDIPGNPHKGTRALLRYQRYFASADDGFSFNLISAYAEHYVPFLNEKRAVRAGTQLRFLIDRARSVCPISKLRMVSDFASRRESSKSVTVYIRKTQDGYSVVGIERTW